MILDEQIDKLAILVERMESVYKGLATLQEKSEEGYIRNLQDKLALLEKEVINNR